jgi:DNA-directed RNA polymerase sigma subunit (sigma70/sigma32)
MDFEPTMAFVVGRQNPPAIEVRVNFGVFAGREATPAEIDRLAEWLLDEVGEISIISEERHEIDAQVEASVHQVRIEVAADRVPEDAAARAELEQRILERAEHWAHVCVAERHAEVSDAF